MSLLFWGLTFGVAGKVVLGIAVILVHGRIVHEHRIDTVVLKTMKRERNLALLGIFLMIVGYVMEIAFYGFTPIFFEGTVESLTNSL
jgi:hypothetical protein